MSDDLDIRAGGLVSVDTDSLRETAQAFRTIAREVDAARDTVGGVATTLNELGMAETALEGPRVAAVASVLAGLHAAAMDIAHRLERLATVYEVIELRAAREIADAATQAGIDKRLDQIWRADPWAPVQATAERAMWEVGLRVPLLSGTAVSTTVLGAPAQGAAVVAAAASAVMLDLSGSGLVSRGPTGSAPTVTVEPVRSDPVSAPPNTLAQAASRIPYDDDARVHIEKYVMPDGTARYGAFITGTRAMVSDEVWNMDSNLSLYGGVASASFSATEQALAAAGAKPGDPVYLFGHSQGAMIAANLALTRTYDTRMLVSFGSPVQAQVSADTLSVEFRHGGDPVALLTGGGNPAPVGSADSLVITRDPDIVSDMTKPSVDSHHLAEYEHTAELADRSADPRMDSVRAALAELGSAVSVESSNYSATRTPAASASANTRESERRTQRVF